MANLRCSAEKQNGDFIIFCFQRENIGAVVRTMIFAAAYTAGCGGREIVVIGGWGSAVNAVAL